MRRRSCTLSRLVGQTLLGKTLATLLSLIIWIGLWYLASSRLNKPLLLPSPVEVARRILALSATASFWKYSFLSLLRVMGGILIGIFTATVTAALTSLSSLFHTLISPLIVTVKTTPVASFIILAMLWVNEGILPMFISFLIVFPVVWSNLHTALTNVPSAYLDVCDVFRLPLSRRIRRVYLPFILPHLLSACHSSLGLAWKAGIAAEAIALPAISIGKQLMESKIYLETTDLFAWTVVVIILSLLLEMVADAIFRQLKARAAHAPDAMEQSANIGRSHYAGA